MKLAPAMLLAVVSGTLLPAGFLGPGLWWTSCVAFVPLLAIADRQPPWRSAALGWTAGFIGYGIGYYWIPGTIHVFGGVPSVASWAAGVLLFAYQGLVFALFTGVLARARRAGHAVVWVAPVTMVTVEMVFPAPVPIRMGYTLQPLTHLIQGVDLLGPLLLTATLVSLNVAVYAAAGGALGRRPFRWLEVTAGPVLVLLLFWYGAVRMPSVVGEMASAPSLRVGVVQPGLGPIEKWRAPVEGLVRCRRGSEAAERRGAELTVWPEAAYTVRTLPPRAPRAPYEVAAGRRVPLLFGAVARRWSPDGATARNSAVMTTPGGEITGVYDKVRLVPVSEALPSWAALSWLRRFTPLRTRIEPGDFPRPLPLAHRGRRWSIGTLICYEDVMPGYVRRVMGATAANLLVSLSNDSWFGETAEPRGHLQVAAFRAVEQRRFLVRATNTGVTALVDPLGRVVAQAPPFQTAVMLGEVRLLRGQTLYQRWGDVPWVLCPAILVLVAVRARLKRGDRAKEATSCIQS